MKKIIGIVIGLVVVCSFVNLIVQKAESKAESNEYRIVSSFTSGSINGHQSSRLTIITDNNENKSNIEVSEDIVRTYIENGFQDMLFSFDELGYAEKLTVEVYPSKEGLERNEKSFTLEAEKEMGSEVAYSIEVR